MCAPRTSRLKKVQTSNDNCTRYCTLSDRVREREFYDNESSYILQSVDFQKLILDVFEASQAHRQQDRRDDKEAELLETLASDYKSDKDSISARVPGTCEWFFEDDRFLAGSPGGAHHGGATHSSDTAVDGEVLRFVWGLYTNLSTTASAILPSPL